MTSRLKFCTQLLPAVWLAGVAAGLFNAGAFSATAYATAYAAADPNPADPETAEAHVASSARPVINDVATRRLRSVADAIATNEFAQARSHLRRLLDSETIGGVVPVPSTDAAVLRYCSVPLAAKAVLRSLPAAERDLFVRQSEASAERRLQASALTPGSISELQEIVRRFPGTSVARHVERLLVNRLLDGHQFWLTQSVMLGLQRSALPGDPNRQWATDRLKQVESLTAQGAVAAAETPAVRHDSTMGFQSWQAAAPFEGNSIGWFQQALEEHRRQAIPVLPQLHPVASGRFVICRTLNQLLAFDLATGLPVWQASSVITGTQRPAQTALVGGLESLASVNMARQVQLDTTCSLMTVDGGRLLCLEQADDRGSLSGGSGATGPRAAGDRLPLRNRLVARRVEDGQVEWVHAAEAGEPGAAGMVPGYFTGVPAVCGDWLVGMLQRDSSLFVYALDRDRGTPVWSLKIGDRLTGSGADSDWASIAGRIVASRGLLICSTGAGLIVAVDPVFRSVVWARRFQRVDEPATGSPLPGSASRPVRRWWQGWRRVTLLEVSHSDRQSRIVYAGPDASGVWILDPATGQEVRHLPVSQPLDLQVLPASSQSAAVGLIVARHSMQAFRPATGDVIWTRKVPEPVGRGAFVDRTSTDSRAAAAAHSTAADPSDGIQFAFPAADGWVRFVSLIDGDLTVGAEMDPGTPRAWTAVSGGLVEQTFEDLRVIDPAELRVAEPVEWRPDDTPQAGRDRKLITALRHAPSPRVLQELIRRTGLARRSESADGSLLESASPVDRPGTDHVVAAIQRARELGEYDLAFALLIDLARTSPQGAVSLRSSGPARVVRYDRWIQGQLTDLLTDTVPAVRETLKKQFATVIQTARDSRDPFALSRLAERLRDVPGVAAVEVLPDGRVGRGFPENEMTLLRLSRSELVPVASRARIELSRLYERHSYFLDAEAVASAGHGLARDAHRPEPPDVAPADSPSTAGGQVAGSQWRAVAPQLMERPDRFAETRYVPVPVRSMRGALFERLNVAVHLNQRSGSSLRFYGDGQAGYWQLELPRSGSALHTWFTLPRGWGIGRLLVLRVGTELHGIRPYSDSGEPRAHLQWTLDLAEGNRLRTHYLVNPVAGFGTQDLTPVDSFDQPMASVGPVQAGYLCYRDRAQLICLDPDSGRQVWTRSEISPDVRCAGDEQSVWLIDDSSGEIVELRSTDGAVVSRSRLEEIARGSGDAAEGAARVLTADGSSWLIGWASADASALSCRRLAGLNMRRRQIEWSLDFQNAGSVFGIGPHWFGVLNSDHQCSVHEVTSGRRLARFAVTPGAAIRSACCSSDFNSHLVALSSEVEAGFQAVGEPRFGFRMPLIRGCLLAISARDGRLLWQQRIEGERMMVDQPRSLPLITLTSRSAQSPSGGHVLRIVDRRTGITLIRRPSGDQVPPFTFDPNQPLQRVDVRFPRSVLRIDYDRP